MYWAYGLCPFSNYDLRWSSRPPQTPNPICFQSCVFSCVLLMHKLTIHPVRCDYLIMKLTMPPFDVVWCGCDLLCVVDNRFGRGLTVIWAIFVITFVISSIVMWFPSLCLAILAFQIVPNLNTHDFFLFLRSPIMGDSETCQWCFFIQPVLAVLRFVLRWLRFNKLLYETSFRLMA